MPRPPEFRILTNVSGSRVEIAIRGELDLATAPQLTAEFERVGLSQMHVSRLIRQALATLRDAAEPGLRDAA